MVRAGTSDCDGANNHQLIEVADIRKFCQRRLLYIATVKNLIDKHLGDAFTGILSVVITLGINNQAL